MYGGFTPLGRVWLSDDYDFKQSTTLISKKQIQSEKLLEKLALK